MPFVIKSLGGDWHHTPKRPFPPAFAPLSVLRRVCLSVVVLGLAAFGLSSGWHARAEIGPLEAGFDDPPASARPLTWWHWINGNVTKDGIAADLASMKEAGIAGVQLFDVSAHLPAGPVRYDTDDWHDHVQFAIKTAARHGLDFTLMNCPGWSASGGPWIPPEKSMKQLLWTETTVVSEGPGAPVSIALPPPPIRENFYRDVSVLAIPAGADASQFRPGSRAAAGSPCVVSARSHAGVPLGAALDGDPATAAVFPAAPLHVVTLELDAAAAASRLCITFSKLAAPCSLRGGLHVSDDGQNYTPVESFQLHGHPPGSAQVLVTFKPAKGRFWRLNLVSSPGGGKPAAFSIAELALSDPPRLREWLRKTKLAKGPVARDASSAAAPPAIPRERILDLTGATDASGHCRASLPAGNWTLLRFGFTSTGRKNGPAVPEGTGLEVDKLDPDAVAFQFGQSLGRVIREAGPLAGKTFTGVLFDSFEARFQNWTGSLPAQFRAMHGYDILPLLPVLTGRVVASPAFTECVLHDFRAAINAGLRDHYFGVMQRLANERGLVTWVETQGGPLDPSVIAPRVDIVMNEFWQHAAWRFPDRLRLTASIANILGKRILAAEAFTALPEDDAWAAAPSALKCPGDHAFASGVNRLVLHSYVHQPRSDAAPGFTLGSYGTRFGRLNTWWPFVRAWTGYIARSQFLLQQGWKHADLLLLQNEDLGYDFPAAELARLPAGYDFDICHPKDLAAMTPRDGALVLPHGPSYRLLVLPDTPWAASIGTLRKLRELADAGLSILGDPPVAPAGARDLEQQEEFENLVAALWRAPGRILRNIPIADALRAAGFARDLDWADKTLPSTLSGGVNFTHRRLPGADIYFVFNHTEKNIATDFTFRVTGRLPELWDALAGARVPAAAFRASETQTTVPLQLPPHGTLFVVFQKSLAENQPRHPGIPPGAEMRAGRLYASAATPAVLLDGPWQVAFANQKLDVPSSPVAFARLFSWSEHPDDAIRHYSGTAVYRKTFTLPENPDAFPGDTAFLDLGRVADIAAVRVNGRDAGILWVAPFRADITPHLRPGENTLEITVANTWANRLIGDQRIPVPYKYQPRGESKSPFASRIEGRLLEIPEWMSNPGGGAKNPRHTFSSWEHYDADSPLRAAGLLGPVKLEWFREIPRPQPPL